MRNGNLLKTCVSEIHVKLIRVYKGVGVPMYYLNFHSSSPIKKLHPMAQSWLPIMILYTKVMQVNATDTHCLIGLIFQSFHYTMEKSFTKRLPFLLLAKKLKKRRFEAQSSNHSGIF